VRYSAGSIIAVARGAIVAIAVAVRSMVGVELAEYFG